MAINIGNEAAQAVADLRGNIAFEKLCDALGVIVQNRIYASLGAHAAERVDQTSHAKGAFEVWEALMMAYRGTKASEVKKPEPPKLRGRDAA